MSRSGFRVDLGCSVFGCSALGSRHWARMESAGLAPSLALLALFQIAPRYFTASLTVTNLGRSASLRNSDRCGQVLRP